VSPVDRVGCSDATTAAAGPAAAARTSTAADSRPTAERVGATRPQGDAVVYRKQAAAEKSGQEPDQRPQRTYTRRSV